MRSSAANANSHGVQRDDPVFPIGDARAEASPPLPISAATRSSLSGLADRDPPHGADQLGSESPERSAKRNVAGVVDQNGNVANATVANRVLDGGRLSVGPSRNRRALQRPQSRKARDNV